MTKPKPITVTPGQENAIASALSTVFHTDACHLAYTIMQKTKEELSSLQKGCSRCLTHVKHGLHSVECSAAYRVFLSARGAYKNEQKKCGKCAVRERLKEGIRG